MLSTQLGYFKCSICREMTKQYVNGKIAYLPVDDPHVLGMSRKPRGYGYVHVKATHRKRPGRHSKKPNKKYNKKPSRGQGK